MRIEDHSGSMSDETMSELEVRILRYEQQGTKNDPMDFAAFGTVLGGGESIGLAPGSAVEVRMSDEPSDTNRLVKDLQHGSATYGVEECGPGSVVRFVGFTDGPAETALPKPPAGTVFRTTTFDVLEAVPAPEAPAADRPRSQDGGPMHAAFLNRPREQEDGGPMHGVLRIR